MAVSPAPCPACLRLCAHASTCPRWPPRAGASSSCSCTTRNRAAGSGAGFRGRRGHGPKPLALSWCTRGSGGGGACGRGEPRGVGLGQRHGAAGGAGGDGAGGTVPGRSGARWVPEQPLRGRCLSIRVDRLQGRLCGAAPGLRSASQGGPPPGFCRAGAHADLQQRRCQRPRARTSKLMASRRSVQAPRPPPRGWSCMCSGQTAPAAGCPPRREFPGWQRCPAASAAALQCPCVRPPPRPACCPFRPALHLRVGRVPLALPRAKHPPPLRLSMPPPLAEGGMQALCPCNE